MSNNHNQDMSEIKKLLWEFREGPAVVGVKRDTTVKLLESCIANMEDLNVIEVYAKERGWNEQMNTTAALWLVDRAKKANDEIADLAHPEFGEIGRLQEEIHELKKEVARVQERESEAVMQAERDAKRADKNAADIGKLRDWASKVIGDKGPDLDAYIDGHVELPNIVELKKEVDWLTFYKREVYQCLGAGVDDVNKELRDAYVKKIGLGGVPEKLRKEYLEYEADHKED